MGFPTLEFLTRADPATFVVYGLARDPRIVLAELAKAGPDFLTLTGRYAVLPDAGNDIRISSPGWIDVTVDERLELARTDDLKLLCREAVLHSTSNFSGPLRRFLESYLNFIERHLRANSHTLEPAAAEVFAPDDWIFSAYLPMPQARVLLAEEADDGGPVFAELDAVFFHQGRLICVIIEGAGMVRKSVQRARDTLFEGLSSLDVVRVSKDAFAAEAFPADMFPDTFVNFWEGLDMPVGPCPPRL